MQRALIVSLVGAALYLLLGASLAEAIVYQPPENAPSIPIIYLTVATVILGVGFVVLFSFLHRKSMTEIFSRDFIILTVIFSAIFF